jgi:cytochrome c biogenesis protein CcmG/thiol:disulfide interchange protein DsbE
MSKKAQRCFANWLLVFGAVLFAGCHQHSASTTKSAQPVIAAGEIGSRLPDFSVKDFQGRKLSSSDFRGKVLLVDVWATWCQPCKKEMPGYQELLDHYGSRGFAVLGLKATMMMDTEDPMQFAREAGVHYPLAIASPQATQALGGILGLPTTFLYDRQGILRYKVIGFEYTNTIEAQLKPLLAQ